MKLLICCLFSLLLIVLALHPLYASEPPLAPFAVCKDGKCTMSEKDYNAYRAWHFALIDRMKELQEENGELSGAVDALRAKLLSEAFCERHRD